MIGPSVPTGAVFTTHNAEKPYVASMGIYVFSRQVLLDVLEEPGIDFGREIIPAALSRFTVQAHLHRDFWADVGTVEAYYEANIALTRSEPPFEFYDSRRPIYTRPRFLPASRLDGCSLREALISEGCYIEGATIEQSIVGLRNVIGAGARITRSLLLGADYYEAEDMAPARRQRAADRLRPRRHARPRDRGQERAHRQRRPPRQRGGRAGGRRRRVLHPQRDHHRAEGGGGEGGDGGVSTVMHNAQCNTMTM